MTEDRYEEAINLMVKVFLKSETICAAAGMAQSPNAVEESRIFFKFVVQLELSIACICEENNELVAVNLLKILIKGDQQLDLPVSVK